MHVKLVVNSFPAASQTFLFNLVTGLERRGAMVTVCAEKKSKDQNLYADRLHEWSGDIDYISHKPYSLTKLAEGILFAITDIALLINCIKEKGFKKGCLQFVSLKYFLKGKPDIIHFAFSGIGVHHVNYLNYLKRKPVKLVVSCRGTAEKIKPLLEPKLRKKLNTLFSKADLVHCVSNNMKNELIPVGLKEEKACVIYPSVQINKFYNSAERSASSDIRWSVVTVGRLSFQKGYAYALQALKILADMNISFTYNIVGDGEDRGMLLYLIQELGLSNFVVMHGKLSSQKVIAILQSADVFLLSSLSEGVSNAALEAMSMALPVVSTKAGGMPEVIQHGENGLLTDWRDPQHMAEQLLWLHQHPGNGIDMGKKARITIEQSFSLDRQIDSFISKYNEVLKS